MMDGRQIDQAVRDQALTKYAQGVPSGEVCAEFGIHRDTLRKWARTVGLDPQVPGKPQHSDNVKAEAVHLYVTSDLRMDEIGARVGAHEETVKRWVRAAGVPRRGQGAPGRARRPRKVKRKIETGHDASAWGHE
jgi:transposase-like protein